MQFPRWRPTPGLQVDIVTISDKSESAATPLSQFLLNDGSKYDARPSFDVKENLGILPFSSGTTGDESPAMSSLELKELSFFLNFIILHALFNARTCVDS